MLSGVLQKYLEKTQLFCVQIIDVALNDGTLSPTNSTTVQVIMRMVIKLHFCQQN